MNLKKLFLTLAVIALAFSLFWGCAAEREAGPETGNGLKTGEEQPPEGQPPEEQPPEEQPPEEEEPEKNEPKNGDEPVNGPLSSELVRKIMEDYRNLSDNEDPDRFFMLFFHPPHPDYEAPIMRYHGTYNGSVVVSFDGMAYQPFKKLDIAGITFLFGGMYTITVWKEGRFYTLEEAYDAGLLALEDLETVAYYQNNAINLGVAVQG